MKHASSTLLLVTSLATAAIGLAAVLLARETPLAARQRHPRVASLPAPRHERGAAAEGEARDDGKRERRASARSDVTHVAAGVRSDPVATRHRLGRLLDEIERAPADGRLVRVHRELNRLLRGLDGSLEEGMRRRLLSMLDTVAPDRAHIVGSALANLRGDDLVAGALVAKLQRGSDDGRTRAVLYDTLARLDVPAVLPVLLDMLHEGREHEPLLVSTIGRLGGDTEARVLLDRLDQPLRADVREEITRALAGMVEAPGFFDEAARRLGDAPPSARRSLLTVLGSSPDTAHAGAVRALLAREADTQVRRKAIEILGRFGDADSGRVLAGLLRKGDLRERTCAAEAISRIRDPATVAMLAAEWSTLAREGRWAVLQAGSRLAAPGEDLCRIASEEAVRDTRMRVRVAAAKLLGRPGRDGHVDALAEMFERAGHPAERAHALQALERIGTQRAVARALSCLRSIRDPESREEWRSRLETLLERTRNAPVPRATSVWAPNPAHTDAR